MKDLLQPPLPDEPLPEPETVSHQPPLPNEPVPDTEPGSLIENVTAISTSSPKTEGTDAIEQTDAVNEPHDVKSTEVKEPEDGWTAIFEPNYNAYYFHNSKTGETTWNNPRANDSLDSAPDGFTAWADRWHEKHVGDAGSKQRCAGSGVGVLRPAQK